MHQGPLMKLPAFGVGSHVASWCAIDDMVRVACELHRDWRNDIEGLATLSLTTFLIIVI